MAAAWVVVSPASAQQRYQTLGPNECLNCHDHQEERQWYEKLEIPEVRKLFPDKGANAGHINSLKQLEVPKSNDFAKAVGLRDKYDVNGLCVRCHATVFAGDANAGVSCESCHGPASGYNKPHQTKGAYEQALTVGMTKLVGNLQGWAQQCTSCHAMDDQRFITAGHPSGDDFDLGMKYAPVALHFKKKYNAAEVSTIGRAQVEALLRKRSGGGAPAAAAVTPPSVASPVVAVAALPPPVSQPSAAPAASAPIVTPAVPQGARAPLAAPPPASTAAASAVSAPAVSAPAVSAPPVAPPVTYAPSTAAATPALSWPSAVALVQGRLIAALTDLLQRGAAAPVRMSTPPPALTPYTGPDAALLQLQREAILLALEALGTAPAPRPAPPQP